MLKKIAVQVGGGLWQIHLVRFLKKRGYVTWVVNPVENETTAEADEVLLKDTKEIEGIASELKRLGSDLKLVASDVSEAAVLTVAHLAKELNLRGNPPILMQRYRNKLLMISHAHGKGIPVPRTFFARTKEELMRILKKEPWGDTFVIKPLDASATRGFTRLENPTEKMVQQAFEEASYYSSGGVLLQEFVVGDKEITIEGLATGGKHRSLVHAQKEFFTTGIASSISYPGGLESGLWEELQKRNNFFVEGSGLDFGLTHAEWVVNTKTGHCWLMEIAARGGGCGISTHVLPYLMETHPYEVLIGSAEGQDFRLEALKLNKKAVRIQFLSKEEMQAIGPERFQDLKGRGSILETQYNFRRFDYHQDEYTDRNMRHSMFILGAENSEVLEWKAQNIMKSLKQSDDVE